MNMKRVHERNNLTEPLRSETNNPTEQEDISTKHVSCVKCMKIRQSHEVLNYVNFLKLRKVNEYKFKDKPNKQNRL